MRPAVKSFLRDGPQGWMGTWLCLALAITCVLMAGFNVAKWYEFVTTTWAVFPSLFGVSLSAQLWNRKNKMQYVPELFKEQNKNGVN